MILLNVMVGILAFAVIVLSIEVRNLKNKMKKYNMMDIY